MYTRLLQIKLGTEAQKSVAEYQISFTRFNDMWAGLQWLLARNPEPIGACYKTTVNGTDYLLCGRDGDIAAGIPDIWVAYTYTEQELVIHDLYACEASEEEA